jgi:hypothetical protein
VLVLCKAFLHTAERVLNVFVDSRSVKRRATGKGRLETLVYARMNMYLLTNDHYVHYDHQAAGTFSCVHTGAAPASLSQ